MFKQSKVVHNGLNSCSCCSDKKLGGPFAVLAYWFIISSDSPVLLGWSVTVQAGFKLTMLPSQPPKGQDYRCALPCVARSDFFFKPFSHVKLLPAPTWIPSSRKQLEAKGFTCYVFPQLPTTIFTTVHLQAIDSTGLLAEGKGEKNKGV